MVCPKAQIACGFLSVCFANYGKTYHFLCAFRKTLFWAVSHDHRSLGKFELEWLRYVAMYSLAAIPVNTAWSARTGVRGCAAIKIFPLPCTLMKMDDREQNGRILMLRPISSRFPKSPNWEGKKGRRSGERVSPPNLSRFPQHVHAVCFIRDSL